MNGSAKSPEFSPVRWARPLAGVALLALNLGALAQDNAPVADAAAAVPKASCSAPAVPEQFRDDGAQIRFVERARTYEACMQAFIEARRRDAAAHTEAGNAAAGEFNAFAAAVAEIQPPPTQ